MTPEASRPATDAIMKTCQAYSGLPWVTCWLHSFSSSSFSGALSRASDGDHNPTVEYDLMLAVIGYQCLPALHARSPDLLDSALGEFAPVAAIADVGGWIDFLGHDKILSAGKLAVNQKW
ncbi:MAG: hypothetical protein V1897_01070 [Pseudomonadota bacterium]